LQVFAGGAFLVSGQIDLGLRNVGCRLRDRASDIHERRKILFEMAFSGKNNFRASGREDAGD